MMDDDYPWLRCVQDHIWFNRVTNKYVFSDEASVFSEQFNSGQEAIDALNEYIKTLQS